MTDQALNNRHVDPQTGYVVELIVLLSAVIDDSNVRSPRGWLTPAEHAAVWSCVTTGQPFSGFMGYRFTLVATSSFLFESE